MTSLAASLLLVAATAQANVAVPANSLEMAQQGASAPAASASPAAEHPAPPGELSRCAEEEDASLAAVMLGHVADSYKIEFPGYCHGKWSAECEVNLCQVFGNRLVFHVGSTRIDMTPTRHLIMMWLASAILLGVVLSATRKRSLVPRGLYNFVELLVQFVRDEIAKKNIGEREGDRFVPYLVTAFFFILFLNLFGLVPWAATASGNINVTLALALFTFIITQYTAFRAQGVLGWLKHLTGGVHFLLWPIMLPVEALGLFTKPFALTIRLFANMIAGHIVILSLLGLIFVLGSPLVAVGSVPMAVAIFLLEMFIAFVQAYIFTMLSSLFIGQGLEHHGEEGEHGAAAPQAAEVSHVGGKVPDHG